MAKPLAILKPLVPVQIEDISAVYSGLANILTPNPKEIAVSNIVTQHFIDYDLGAAYDLDTFFVGFLDQASAGLTVKLYSQVAFGGARTAVAGGDFMVDAPGRVDRHAFLSLAAPINAQYFSIRFLNGAVPESIGVVAAGKAWTCQWGHEQGSGRPIEDTSNVERLFGGGFGINEGAIAGGYQWTFGDLQPDEVEELYQLTRRLGNSRTCLVAEQPDAATYVGARLHWGLFDRLEPYERLNPLDTRWAFKIRDWT